MKPVVVCIMLANGRAEMVRRAVVAFYEQEHKAKRLLIWNTGTDHEFDELDDTYAGHVAVIDGEAGSIGVLRNRANSAALRLFPEADIFAHWDSDDWSHPRRLAEQVELLENTRADIVGYREALFWDTTINGLKRDCPTSGAGSAWTYRTGNPAGAFGASMLYPRATWERKPFPPNHKGEDTLWLLHGRFKVHAVPSTWSALGLPGFEPRMICGVHGGNTSMVSIPQGVTEWKRAAAFDGYCRKRMEA